MGLPFFSFIGNAYFRNNENLTLSRNLWDELCCVRS